MGRQIKIKKGDSKMKEKWIYLDTISEMGITVDEYTNEAGTMTKLIWADGYEEIFEKA